MSLLLDARKKSQKSALGNMESAVDEHRTAGHNLFAAKKTTATGSKKTTRNLLLGLVGTALLMGGGLGYLSYMETSSTSGLRVMTPPPVTAQAAESAAPIEPASAVAGIDNEQKTPLPDIIETPIKPADLRAEHAPSNPSPTAKSRSLTLKKTADDQVDPALQAAYEAYSSGRLAEAEQLYRGLYQRDNRNTDVLLGLGAIAQQRGENNNAAQYYMRVLQLDPRNAVANAGMSAISAEENSESRLKNLLREQGNSPSLNFALGNLYASESRWSEAQQSYFTAFSLAPNNAEFAFNLAVSLDHLGQTRLASQHYQRAIQLDPSHSAGFSHNQIAQRIAELE